MLQVLVKFVFQLIVRLFDIIFSPIIAVLMGLFPDISSLASNCILFITTVVVPGLKFVLSMLYNLLRYTTGFFGCSCYLFIIFVYC